MKLYIQCIISWYVICLTVRLTYSTTQEEHIHQLLALVGFLKNYHENSLRILDEVQSNIQSRAFEAQAAPKEELRPVARISSVQRSSISSPSEPRPIKPTSGLAGPPPPAKPVAAKPVPKCKGNLVIILWVVCISGSLRSLHHWLRISNNHVWCNTPLLTFHIFSAIWLWSREPDWAGPERGGYRHSDTTNWWELVWGWNKRSKRLLPH